ncbi:MAG: mannose-6-phosphate isomerase, partial [Anaerolineaceae bacterium]|nr:mannose-6-phosphate isomerase [Anaerolineaceae bacterium]
GTHFHILTALSGELDIAAGDDRVTLTTGQTALIPACLGMYTLTGTGRVLRSF